MRANANGAGRKLTISLESELEAALHAERARLAQELGLPRVSLTAMITRALRAGLAATTNR